MAWDTAEEAVEYLKNDEQAQLTFLEEYERTILGNEKYLEKFEEMQEHSKN